jgi:hypothetical protein
MEVRSAIKVALADQNAQIEPVPMIGGGHLPEPELDRLSNILHSFNEQFGNIDWKDGDKIRNVISKDIPTKVSADKAYQNAMKRNGWLKQTSMKLIHRRRSYRGKENNNNRAKIFAQECDFVSADSNCLSSFFCGNLSAHRLDLYHLTVKTKHAMCINLKTLENRL